MWFIGVEVEQERSAPPPKKNPGSAPAYPPKWSEKSLRQKLLHISLIVSGIGIAKEDIIIGLWSQRGKNWPHPWGDKFSIRGVCRGLFVFVQGHAHQIKFIVDWGRGRSLENADLKIKQISCKAS